MRECKFCGKELERRQKSYCSRACRNRDITRKDSKEEPKYPRTCVECGKEFMSMRPNTKYCSDQCNWKVQARKRVKRGKPSYKMPQGKVWNEKRQIILKEQNNLCWLCGKELDKFELHHMEYGDHSVNSDSLVVLCKSCHNRIHHVTVTLNKSNELEFHGVALDLLEKKLK